ncbi:hypothetical protein BVZ28_13945 [Alcaligenes faecalis]|uniref:Uncharacterized protein n=1 Tax=Alcaligenes faecalis TaxID=511 RepID=A0A1Z3ML52_ALCFA|nr:hypothetical protein [Alcaligenes faecalis]OSZ33107.1 hypothetical protein BVZ28_13945 [Alcaligenes faecalis]OSZ41183.1 hypothetical protein BVZ29_13500 [Alcaligenes faecalis]RSE57609.1 hypothetical protein EGT81_19425 [Alcaligenes faecalis]
MPTDTRSVAWCAIPSDIYSKQFIQKQISALQKMSHIYQQHQNFHMTSLKHWESIKVAILMMMTNQRNGHSI